MVELAKLMTSSGAGQIVVGIALAWIILNLHLLKARAKEDREAAEKRSKADREAAEKLTRELIAAVEKRAKEDRETADKCAKEDRKTADKRAQEDREVVRQLGVKNAEEHAALTAAVHGLDNKVEVLLDRSKRPGSDDGAD